MSVDTGEGDDALALYVAKMAESELVAPPCVRASYSQVGYNLAGRIIEKVTGLTYEQAVSSLLFELPFGEPCRPRVCARIPASRAQASGQVTLGVRQRARRGES